MADEKLNDKFFEMGRNLARHELEVSLKRFKEQCLRVAKLVARDVAAGKKPVEDLQKMNELVRKTYANEPRKMAEWEEVMRGFEFSEDTVEDEE